MDTLLIQQDISLQILFDNKFIMSEQHIDIYVKNIEKYNTIMPYTITNFKPNQLVSLEYNECNTPSPSVKITFNQSVSTPGIVYSEFLELDASIKHLLVTYETDNSINVFPYIRDGSMNDIYWQTRQQNLIFKNKINNKYTYVIKIPDIPDTCVEKFKLYLLSSSNFENGDSVTISNINIVKVEKLPKIYIRICI
jgi:hypothetical protein